MRIIRRTGPLHGELKVPGDRYITHRSIIAGAIAEGDTLIEGCRTGTDAAAAIDCLRRLGVAIDELDRFSVLIHGQGLTGLHAPDGIELNAGKSRGTACLLPGILAGQSFTSHLSGDEALSRHSLEQILSPLEKMGILCVPDNEDSRLPMTVMGGRPKGIHYDSPVSSARVKSCVLLAGLYAEDPTFYTEPVLSRTHTEHVLEAFGVNLKQRVNHEGHVTTILYPGTALRGQTVAVPGDLSSAAYIIAAALIVPGSSITVRNTGINETRDGILRVIRAMGGRITLRNVRMECGEPVADISAQYSELHGTVFYGNILPLFRDELPLALVLAACAKGDTEIRDLDALRPSDRKMLMNCIRSLRKMGIRAITTENGLLISGGDLMGSAIDPHRDARIAMAFSVAGLAAHSPVQISDERCVSGTYPGFFRDLEQLGTPVRKAPWSFPSK